MAFKKFPSKIMHFVKISALLKQVTIYLRPGEVSTSSL